MNYPTKEAIQQIHASPRTADEERLSSDLLAWREIAERLADELQGATWSPHRVWRIEKVLAAYEKAVQS